MSGGSARRRAKTPRRALAGRPAGQRRCGHPRAPTRRTFRTLRARGSSADRNSLAATSTCWAIPPDSSPTTRRSAPTGAKRGAYTPVMHPVQRRRALNRVPVAVGLVVVLMLAVLAIPTKQRCGAPGYSCASAVDDQGNVHYYYYEVEPVGVYL